MKKKTANGRRKAIPRAALLTTKKVCLATAFHIYIYYDLTMGVPSRNRKVHGNHTVKEALCKSL